jgi:hypothetical protein
MLPERMKLLSECMKCERHAKYSDGIVLCKIEDLKGVVITHLSPDVTGEVCVTCPSPPQKINAEVIYAEKEV